MDPRPTLEDLLAERDWLRRVAFGLVKDAAAADDLTQDVWRRALERAPAHVRHPRAWLGTVLRNLAASRSRAERRHRDTQREAPPRPMVASPPEVLARAELIDRVGHLVLELPEPYRATVLLSYFEDLPPRKVAARMGVPVETVRTRLKRARARLAVALDARHGGDRRAWAAPLAAWLSPATATLFSGPLLGAFAVKKTAVLVVLLAALVLVGWQAGVFRSDDGGAGGPGAGDASDVETAAAPTLEGRGSERADGTLPMLPPGAPEPASSGGTWSGRVVDPEGRGIAGALVALAWQEAPRHEALNGLHLLIRRERERRDRPSAITDEAGHFTIRRPYGGRAILVARADGYAPGVSAFSQAGTPVEIRLTPDERMAVRVTGPEGDALRDVEVRLVATGWRPRLAPLRRVLAASRTGSDGVAHLPVPAARQLRLEVAPDDPALGFHEEALVRGQRQADVELPAVRVIERRIVDALTGHPVAGAYVQVLKTFKVVSYQNEPVRRRFDADAQGQVRFPHQEGYFAQYATAPGYEVVHAWEDPVRLPRAMRIEGVVLSAAGEPVPDVPVLILQAGGTFDRLPAGLPLVSAWSESSGRFRAEVKLPWPGHLPTPPDRGIRTVVALHPEWPAAVRDGVRVESGGTADVTLSFGKPAALEVSVADPAGQPTPEQWIGVARLIPAAETWPAKLVGTWPMVDLKGLVASPPRRTDAEGRLTITGLAPGTWRVYSENVRTQVELGEGESREVRLVVGGGLAITGRVFKADGSPAASRPVSLSGPTASSKRTDAEGRFRFADLSEGQYVVSAFWRAGASHFGLGQSARPGEEVELRIPAGPSRLRLLVEGPPPEAIEYSLWTPNGGAPRDTGTAPLDPETGLTEPFSPGSGVVVVKAEGFAWTAVPFEAPAATTTDVKAVLVPGGAVKVRLDGAHRGKRCMVRLVPAGPFPESLFEGPDDPRHYAIDRSLGSAEVYLRHENGAFERKDIRPGPYRASYGRWNPDTRTWESGAAKRLEVRSGKTTEIALSPP